MVRQKRLTRIGQVSGFGLVQVSGGKLVHMYRERAICDRENQKTVVTLADEGRTSTLTGRFVIRRPSFVISKTPAIIITTAKALFSLQAGL
jgi:hypothetical protein